MQLAIPVPNAHKVIDKLRENYESLNNDIIININNQRIIAFEQLISENPNIPHIVFDIGGIEKTDEILTKLCNILEITTNELDKK